MGVKIHVVSLVAIWSIAYTLIQRHRYTHRLRSICHCLLSILFGGIGCNFDRHLDHHRLTSHGNRKSFQYNTRCPFNSSNNSIRHNFNRHR